MSSPSLHEFYFIGSIPTVIGSFLVIISYIFTPELRYHPSVLIFYRCIIDLILGLCLSYFWFINKGYIFNNDSNYSYSSICRYWLGPLTEFLFITNIFYFLALSTGLYKCIKNPFSSPNDVNLTKVNILIFIIAIGIVTFIRIWPSVEYEYESDIQLCLVVVDDDNKMNEALYGIAIYYGPLLLTLIYGIFVTLSAYIRLRKGLPNTFFIRKKVIRDAWSYCLIFLLYIIIVAASYIIIRIKWVETYIFNNDQYMGKKIFAIAMSSFGLADFIVFIIVNYDKLFKQCKICSCCCYDETYDNDPYDDDNYQLYGSTNTSNTTIEIHGGDLLKPLHPKQLSLFDDHKNIYSSNTQNTKLIKYLTQQKHAKYSCFKKCYKRIGISVNKSKSKQETINEALRREVIAYTTDGIAQALAQSKAATMTLNSYPRNIRDHGTNIINKFNVRIQNNWAVTFSNILSVSNRLLLLITIQSNHKRRC